MAATLVVAEAKNWLWEEFGKAVERDFQLASKMFWQTTGWVRKGKPIPGCACFGWITADSNWGCCRAVEGALLGHP